MTTTDREHVVETTLLDKSEWRAGQHEPDRVEWRYRGVPCLLRRSPMSGAWCGYAATSEGHPWFGNVDLVECSVDVHGGVTFARMCEGDICHVPRPGEPDHVFWIGWDAGHAFDFSPKMEFELRSVRSPYADASALFHGTIYCDKARAMIETEELAEQILAAA
jgi:hypothetical protein